MFKFRLFQLLALFGMQCLAKQLFGPYDIVVSKLYKCVGMKENVEDIIYDTKLQIYNRTAVFYTSNVTVPHGFHDNMKGTADLAVLKNGAWKKNFINFRLNKVCSDTTTLFPKLLPSFMKAAGISFTQCPIKAGTYNVQNWFIDFRVPTGVFPYNTYKVEAKLIDSGKVVACMIGEIEVVPKV